MSKAEINGYRAIVVTCDHTNNRMRDFAMSLFNGASKYDGPELVKSMLLPNVHVSYSVSVPKYEVGSLTWKHIEWLRSLTKLPIVSKGILSPVDAELAIQYGVNGIIVRLCFYVSSADFIYGFL